MRARFLPLLTALVVAGAAPAAPAAPVVGGQPTTRPYAFMASLQTPQGNHRCGAILVHKRWFLTAAHCVDQERPEELRFMIGSADLSRPGDVVEARKIIVHEDYEMAGGLYGVTHDIALVQLVRKAKQKPIAIVGLAQKHLWEPGTVATALGWGSTGWPVGGSPDRLQQVEVPIVSDLECRLSYPADFQPETMVCAGERTGGEDTCGGDSGGPLLVPDDKGRFVVMGTVSWGNGCALPLNYGVYGRVGDDTLRTWLSEHLPGKL